MFHVPFSGEQVNRLKIDETQRGLTDLELVIGRLEHRLHKQGVVMQALFALLQETTGVSEEALLDRVRRIEEATQDAGPRICAKCGRTAGPRPDRCMYCGEARQVESAFELL